MMRFFAEHNGLRIRSHYPDDLPVTAEPFVATKRHQGKVFRSDSGEAISNSYTLLTSEGDEPQHFDTRTDEKGEHLFGAGDYTAAIYAWFPKRSEVPRQNPIEQKTVDGGEITVEWQWKSQAFMEIGEEVLHLQPVDHARHTNKAGVPTASGRPQCLYVK